MEIVEVKTQEALEKCFPVLKELREDLTFQNYTYLYEEAKSHDDYRLVAVFENHQCIALMGYRILFDFVHGKHLYIDDLVVTASKRSSGIGGRLLEFAEQDAERLSCKGLRLCTGIDRKNSQHFYERSGWLAKAITYKKKLGDR